MKKYKGIIFDFNGTLFWDTPKHEQAWQIFAKESLNLEIDRREYYEKMHGSTNANIYKYLYKKDIEPENELKFGQEKEEIYRRLCLEEKEKTGKLPLAPGAEQLLDFLKENNIPCAIATSSERINVDFFNDVFNLRKWFENRIIFADGTFRGKPFPDIYIKAGKLIDIPMKDLIIFEDANAGVQAAKSAGAGLVIGVAPYGKDEFVGKEYTDLIISDFTEFDFNLLER